MSKSQMRLHALVLTALLIPSQSSPQNPNTEPVRQTLQCAQQAGLTFGFTVEGVGSTHRRLASSEAESIPGSFSFQQVRHSRCQS